MLREFVEGTGPQGPIMGQPKTPVHASTTLFPIPQHGTCMCLGASYLPTDPLPSSGHGPAPGQAGETREELNELPGYVGTGRGRLG